MKDIEVQARILEYLMTELKYGNKNFVNILLEFTGEISFKKLRSATYTLAMLGYIQHDDNTPDYQGLLCKITKDGIKHHQDIFQPVKTETKIDLNTYLQNIKNFFENIKVIVTTIILIFSTLLSINFDKIIQTTSSLASLINIQIQTEQKNNVSQHDKKIASLQKKIKRLELNIKKIKKTLKNSDQLSKDEIKELNKTLRSMNKNLIKTKQDLLLAQ